MDTMNARSLIRLIAVVLAIGLPVTIAMPWAGASEYLNRFVSPSASSIMLTVSIASLWAIAIVFLARKDRSINRVNLVAELAVAIVLMIVLYFWQTTAFLILFELMILAWTTTVIVILAPRPHAATRK
ncbi:MAG: hypothetical protein Q4P71_07230 [Actinomycetaceae bacterium]|nr:hypothetical protein [Actinomycetaceae bacterium]